jgi:hypothetical protein
MKRFILLVIVAALAAAGIVYGLRYAAHTTPVEITALLSRGTIIFVHVPSFNRTRDDWHSCDLYQLYREPAVQDFLGKPLSQLPKRDAASQIVGEVEQLDVKDAFVAVTSIENNNPRFSAGFRFRGGQSDAEKIVGRWRSLLVRDPSVRETVQYEQHNIEIVGAAPNSIATVYDGSWFFASNDLAELKAILDRVDHRARDRETTLQADKQFRAAMAHMPSSYALLFYLQPKTFTERLATLPGPIGQQVAATQQAGLNQLRSVCGTTRFERGKIHDVIFAGLPRASADAPLTRSSVQLGTADTFLFLANLLNFEKLATANQTAGLTPFGGWFRKVYDASARAGITLDDWKAAFEPEAGSLGDWPENAHWPSLVVTIPVKDPTRATKIVKALMTAIDEDAPWASAEKEGVNYFYMQSPASLIAFTPTIALSNQRLVAGIDSASVEAAMKRTVAPDGRKSSTLLANSSSYKDAARSLPAPTSFSAYIDTKLLYSRLDAAVRPIFLMTAAFMPAVSEHVDAAKLPDPQVVTRHLSPIVCSQYYDRDGYVAESVGPVTFNQGAIGIGLPIIVWAMTHEHGH